MKYLESYSYYDEESPLFDIYFKQGKTYPYLNKLFIQPDGRRHVYSGYENRFIYLHLTIFRYNIIFDLTLNSVFIGVDEAKKRDSERRRKTNLKPTDIND